MEAEFIGKFLCETNESIHWELPLRQEAKDYTEESQNIQIQWKFVSI